MNEAMIISDPAVMMGKPVVAGTRITVDLILEKRSQRLVPSDEVLEGAYRRAMVIARINHAFEKATESAIEQAEAVTVPKSLRRQLLEGLTDRTEAWDKALYRLVKSQLYPHGDE